MFLVIVGFKFGEFYWFANFFKFLKPFVFLIKRHASLKVIFVHFLKFIHSIGSVSVFVSQLQIQLFMIWLVLTTFFLFIFVVHAWHFAIS